MIVIRKTSTTKLIKGARYQVQTLWNGSGNQNWRQGRIRLVGLGTYSVDGFTDINGNPVPKVNYQNPNVQETKLTEGSEVKDGDILVCLSDRYKNLTKGAMYQVEKVFKEEYQVKNFTTGGPPYTRVEYYVKFKIMSRKIRFWGWNFRKLTTAELRDFAIGDLLGEGNDKVVTDPNIKKIDLVPNKNKLLIQFLAKTILDDKRHQLSPLDWCCQKVAHNWGLKPEDFGDLMKMSMEDLFKKMEENG
jgi:hypothetical protein